MLKRAQEGCRGCHDIPCGSAEPAYDLYNGLKNRFNQETLNLISAIIGRLIELKTEEFDIELLSLEFVLNSDELEGELRLLRSLPDFVAESSNKTIHQRLEKLLSIALVKELFQTKFGKNKIKKPHVARKIGCNEVDICKTRTIASQINYDDVIDEFKNCHPFDRR
ncbi:DUF4371 domain-containing protein [Aphis craccivora]|uniref:DUF4371 domain-containing protein n=1 Tax=Aphis craccivora TaxID=307492 RepID=A0A6G0ZKJ3_APHCR|nr:DUF4371 domain-containing protein [Aphis craccivora]